MVLLIAGSSHTGKTALAQCVLEKYGYSYLSIDHLKMGLIRSGQTSLTPDDDEQLTEYLWPIVREMIKTAIENGQNLTVEGCYIPFNWQDDFSPEYRSKIRFICIIMSKKYITEHFDDIKRYANVIEQRLDDGWLTPERLIKCNSWHLEECKSRGYEYILIDNSYDVDIDLKK